MVQFARLAGILLLLAGLLPAPPAAEAATLPGDIAIPLPRADDKGVVTLSRIHLSDSSMQTVTDLSTVESFAWLSPSVRPDPDGALREVARVFEQIAPPNTAPFSVLHEVNFSQERTVAHARIDVSSVAPSTFYNRTVYRFTTEQPRAGFSTASPFCGLFMPGIQGTSIPLDRDVVLFKSSCYLPDMNGAAPLAAIRFRAVKTETVGDITAIAFASLPDGRATVWLAPGIAYPLRISVAKGSLETPTYDVYRLIRLDHDAGNLASHPPSGGEKLPPVAMAIRPPWGIEVGTSGAFSLREAYEAALNNTANPRLREFLQTHTDAYTSQANYGENVGSPTELREWHFTVTDSTASLLVGVTQRRNSSSSTPTVLAASLAMVGKLDSEQSADSSYLQFSYEDLEIDPEQQPPPPALIPTLVPTHESAIARWEAYASPEFSSKSKAPAILGFTTYLERCVDRGKNCDRAHVQIEVGTRIVERTKDGPYLASSILTIDDKGNALILDETYIRPVPPPPSQAVPWSTETIRVLNPAPQTGLDDLVLEIGYASAFAALVVLGFLWLKQGGLIAAYSRFLPSEDESTARSRIKEIIRSKPGIHTAAIAREATMPEGTARYHLRRMLADGTIVAEKLNGLTAHRLQSVSPSVAIATAFRSSGARAIIRSAHAAPGASGRQLSSLTHLNPATVTYHIARLRRAGIVEAVRHHKEMQVRLTAAGQAAWATYCVNETPTEPIAPSGAIGEEGSIQKWSSR